MHEDISRAQTAAKDEDVALAAALTEDYGRLRQEIGRLIVGQEEPVELVLLTLLAGGNSLLVGVPGLAKTLLVHTVAQVLDLRFSRIQFTPDLMPSDITGTDLVQEDPASGRRELQFVQGPVFANILLADEINRTPPKTQSALLEAMQERRVSVQGRTYGLPTPFFVFATRNPIELEGTYPLPEAQLDRFMFEIELTHLPEVDELAVVTQTTSAREVDFSPVLDGPRILAYQQLVRRVPLAEEVARYALALVRASRPEGDTAPAPVREWVTYGASVRAAQWLVLGAKARALTRGRYHVGFDDVRALARPVLRHRILRNFHAEAERMGVLQIVDELLAAVTPPVTG